jgi:hypothetical protein
MRKWMTKSALGVLVLGSGLLLGCPGGDVVNPFLTLIEQEFIPFNAEDDVDGELVGGAQDGVAGGGGVTEVDDRFRDSQTITFNNNSARGDLEFNFLAWVNATSIQDDDDREALLNSNYIELDEEVRIGRAFILAPGTFVYNGGGVNGNRRFRIPRGTDASTEGATNDPGEVEDIDAEDIGGITVGGGGDLNSVAGVADAPVSQQLILATPDRILIYLDAPDSCDSTAFVFVDQGEILSDLEESPSSRFGPFKPLAAAEYIQCDPLVPALALKVGGGTRLANEYFEGELITLDFFLTPIVRSGDLRDINQANFLFATFGGGGDQFVSVLDLDTPADGDGDGGDDGDDGDDAGGGDDDDGNILGP